MVAYSQIITTWCRQSLRPSGISQFKVMQLWRNKEMDEQQRKYEQGVSQWTQTVGHKTDEQNLTNVRSWTGWVREKLSSSFHTGLRQQLITLVFAVWKNIVMKWNCLTSHIRTWERPKKRKMNSIEEGRARNDLIAQLDNNIRITALEITNY